MQRNKELKAALLHLGYGVTAIRGNNIENFGTINAVEFGKNSFFVVNLKNDANFKQHIFELSEYYNQDCFLYKPKDSMNAYNIGTNLSEYPGYGNMDNIGEFHINIESEFLSRIGNSSFSFTNNQQTKQDNTEYNFKTIKHQRTKTSENKIITDAMKMSLYENYQYGSKRTIASIHEKINRNLSTLKIQQNEQLN